jgi:transposase
MDETALKLKLSEVFPLLNERQRRIVAASEAKACGRGGISVLSRVTGLSRQTIYHGMNDLQSEVITDRIRSPGAGRKRVTECFPELERSIESIIESEVRGDPESFIRWTCKSVRNLESELRKQRIKISYRSIANVLHELGYSLQSNRKRSVGKADHPDRDEQFRHINRECKRFIGCNDPVISVDTKKKELIGKYRNNGQEWTEKGKPTEVLTHDFPDPKVPKAVPYGVYDLASNTGWVNVGIDGDTAEFAVESIRQWWIRMGRKRYPKTRNLLICADSGWSSAYRSHLWKRELQLLCDRYKMSVSVCHFPPGTSKWNKIEHRLFSFISVNWRGRPLVDYQTVVNLIASTTTRAGLSIKARLDKKKYSRGIKISLAEMKSLKIIPAPFHGEWNYKIIPRMSR